MMSKKNYESVAAVIKREVVLVATLREGSEIRKSASESIKNIAVGLSDSFFLENKKFSSHTFLIACGFQYDSELKTYSVPVSKPQKVSMYDISEVTWTDPKCGCERSPDVGRDVPCPTHGVKSVNR